MPSSAPTKYTALSLFSGCGGFCEGVELAGFKILAAVEQDRFAAETYRHNFPSVPLFEGDIKDFRRPASKAWAEQRDRFKALEETEIDLVFGGPPCQGYSQIGPRDIEDPRNALYGQFVRVLRDIRPRVFVMENVPNMLALRKGLFKKRALAAFRRAGYANCGVHVLHATDFGVPQLRKRAVFLGVRDDVDFPLDAASWIERSAEELHVPHATVWEAIGDLPERVSADDRPVRYPRLKQDNPIAREMRLDCDGVLYGSRQKLAGAGGSKLLHNHHTKEIQKRRKDLIALLKPGMKGDSLPEDVWNGLRPEKWRRLHPDRAAYTILAQMHRDLSEWVHPKYERWITVREAARLQSFHDGFVFKSSEWQMLKQIGNAVPPLLGRAVAVCAQDVLRYADGEDFSLDGVTGRQLELAEAAAA